MADVHFVFFDRTTGTAAARPVLRSYVEDEADVPDYALLGLDPATVGHVRLSVFDVPDPEAPGVKATVTVNSAAVLPTTPSAYAIGTRPVQTLAAAQAEAEARLDQLIEDVARTQRLDARITGASRRAILAYIDDLREAPTTYATLWATDPLAIFTTTSPTPFPVPPVPTAAATDQGEILERGLHGGNFVDNSRFEDGTRGWTLSGSAGSTVLPQTTLSLRAPGTTWAGPDYPTMQMVQVGTAANGFTDFTQVATGRIARNGSVTPRLMPVKPGDWVEFSAAFSAHRCTGVMFIGWVDAAGTMFSNSSGNPAIPEGLGSDVNPDEWPRRFKVAQAPAGAAFAIGVIRKFGTLAGASQANSLLIWDKPLLGPGHERQDQPSQYQPESPRFLPRGQARDGMATDQWEAGRVGYVGAGHAEYTGGGMDVVNFTLGDLPETDQFILTMTARARSQGTTTVSVFFQYQVRQDGGAFGSWVTMRQWSTADGSLPLQSGYTMLTHAQIVTGEFDEIRLRVRFGGVTGSTAEIIGRTKVKVRRGVL